ncbi:MAG: murein hydrolase activator EnvC [Halothiobacillaceae bacterium]
MLTAASINRIFSRTPWFFLGWVVLALGSGWVDGALATEASIQSTTQELEGVQQDIKAERERLRALDAKRDAELAKLRILENQQAEAARALYAAQFALSSKQNALADLRARHSALDAEIVAGLASLEDNLRALYLLGAGNGLEGVLSPGGRADKMRVEGYLAELRASRVEALRRLRVAREDNLRVQHEIEFALEELTRLQLVAEAEQASLDGLRAEHDKVVAALDARYSASEAKVRQMTKDQDALERTLQKLEQAEAQAAAEAQAKALAKVEAEAKAAAEKKQREAEAVERRQDAAEQQKRAEVQKRNEQNKEDTEQRLSAAEAEVAAEKSEPKSVEKTAEKKMQAEHEAAEAPQKRTASPADSGEIPVSGRKVRGFGEPTGVGELRSRGIFFAAPEGSRVRALSEGKVVFADWVRGYGNLVIVQHKGGYLSLYAQNEALLKSVGARVQRGEVLATAGRSGGERQTGVYVEVRRGGQPMNPVRWSAWPKK